MSLAALYDHQVAALAAAGDQIAQAELIRRGLADDPALAEAARDAAAYIRRSLASLESA
jgi:hypothetical protein